MGEQPKAKRGQVTSPRSQLLQGRPRIRIQPTSEAVKGVPPPIAPGKPRSRESLHWDVEWSPPGIHTPPSEDHLTCLTLSQALPENPHSVLQGHSQEQGLPSLPRCTGSSCPFQPAFHLPTSCSAPTAIPPAPRAAWTGCQGWSSSKPDAQTQPAPEPPRELVQMQTPRPHPRSNDQNLWEWVIGICS